MTQPEEHVGVNIQPDVGVLLVLPHLNYRPWYALAEFVDNSLESFLRYKSDIHQVDGGHAKLNVEVVIDTSSGQISVRDNAAGIHHNEYERAFRLAEPPPQANGLSEFGMGMKSAACWFGSSFSVRSSALGEDVERTLTFDIKEIVKKKSVIIPVNSKPAQSHHHYTEVVIDNLHRPPQTKTITKIKEHLASIFRVFIRNETLELTFRSGGVSEILEYRDPEILSAPPALGLIRKYGFSNDPITWRKEIDFDFGGGQKVTGFAALRKKASTSTAGFALFRRDRLIEGSGEDSYRPPEIFGASTTAPYQRIFGELHLEGFDVSHTKDGFQWDENESPFLGLLKEHMNSTPMPLIDQARDALYGPSRKTNPTIDGAIEDAVKETGEALQAGATSVLEDQTKDEPNEQPPLQSLPLPQKSWPEQFDIEINSSKWRVRVEIADDPSISEWVRTSDTGEDSDVRQLTVSLSLSHPFTRRFASADPDRLKPLVRIAAAIGLAEITARESGVKFAGEVRKNINQLLGDVLSES